LALDSSVNPPQVINLWRIGCNQISLSFCELIICTSRIVKLTSWHSFDAAKSPGSTSTGAIAGGVAAGAALLFAAPAIGFAWWRRRRPIEAFFDVPGKKLYFESLMWKFLCTDGNHILKASSHEVPILKSHSCQQVPTWWQSPNF
jgi:hypothetical protein